MVSDTYTLIIADAGVSTPADLSVTTAKIVDLNVTTGKIADSAITSAKIANGTIVEADIANSAITSIKIADGTITGTDIATGTITSTNILDGTILADDIAANAIITSKILDQNVTAAKIASKTIVAGNIADATITTTQLATNAVGAINIAADAVTTAKILDSNVTAGKIATDAVTTAKILDLNVTTGKIAASAVTTAKILDLNVTAGKLAADAVTTSKILDLNVTTGKIAADAVTTAKILDSNVTAGKIATDAVTTAKILDLNVTAGKLATDAVTAGKIAADAVTTAKILDLNVTAGKLATDSVTTAKITNLNVTTGKLADNAVDFTKFRTIASKRLIGNAGASTANASEISCTDFGFSLLDDVDASAARTTLGLSSMATQAKNSVDITGGTISGITLSGTSLNVSSATGTLQVANGGTGVASATGSGSTVLSVSPALTTPTFTAPILGTPASGTLTSCTGLPLSTGVAGILPVANGGTGYGSDGISVFKFDTTPASTAANAGEMSWNTTDQTLDLKLSSAVTLQIGQESNLYVHNEDTVTIPNGSVVYISGASGSTPAVMLASNNDASGKKILGIATQAISSGANGYITIQGLVRDINTSSYSTGVALYLGTGGALTQTMPSYPAIAARVAVVVSVNASTGIIYVHSPVLIDNIVVGQFTWSGNVTTGPTQTVTGLTSTANVIIQERNTVSPLSKSYSVVCNTGTFVPYSDAGASMNGKFFSYIAFL